MDTLIKEREEALSKKHKSYLEFMQNMYDNKRVSPSSFANRKKELEVWVSRNREQIKKSKD